MCILAVCILAVCICIYPYLDIVGGSCNHSVSQERYKSLPLHHRGEWRVCSRNYGARDTRHCLWQWFRNHVSVARAVCTCMHVVNHPRICCPCAELLLILVLGVSWLAQQMEAEVSLT